MNEFITEKQAADYLGVSRGTLGRWREKLGVPHHRLGHTVRYRVSDLEAWIDACKTAVPELADTAKNAPRSKKKRGARKAKDNGSSK